MVVNLEGREVPDDRFLIRIYLFLAGENFRKVVLSRGMEFSSYLEVAELADKLFRVNSFEEIYQVEEIELFDRVDTFEIFNTEIKMERIEKVSECAKKVLFSVCKKEVFVSESAPFLFCKNIFEADINYVMFDFNFIYPYFVKRDLISKNSFVSFNLSLKTHFVQLGGMYNNYYFITGGLVNFNKLFITHTHLSFYFRYVRQNFQFIHEIIINSFIIYFRYPDKFFSYTNLSLINYNFRRKGRVL